MHATLPEAVLVVCTSFASTLSLAGREAVQEPHGLDGKHVAEAINVVAAVSGASTLTEDIRVPTEADVAGALAVFCCLVFRSSFLLQCATAWLARQCAGFSWMHVRTVLKEAINFVTAVTGASTLTGWGVCNFDSARAQFRL